MNRTHENKQRVVYASDPLLFNPIGGFLWSSISVERARGIEEICCFQKLMVE